MVTWRCDASHCSTYSTWYCRVYSSRSSRCSASTSPATPARRWRWAASRYVIWLPTWLPWRRPGERQREGDDGRRAVMWRHLVLPTWLPRRRPGEMQREGDDGNHNAAVDDRVSDAGRREHAGHVGRPAACRSVLCCDGRRVDAVGKGSKVDLPWSHPEKDLDPVMRGLQLRFDFDSTAVRQAFDGFLTAYQRSLRSQWRNPLATVTPTYLFNYFILFKTPDPIIKRSETRIIYFDCLFGGVILSGTWRTDSTHICRPNDPLTR